MNTNFNTNHRRNDEISKAAQTEVFNEIDNFFLCTNVEDHIENQCDLLEMFFWSQDPDGITGICFMNLIVAMP